MVAIQYIDRTPAARTSDSGHLLMRAAMVSQEAPSAGDSQPWRWRIDGDRAALLEDDRSRVPGDIDGRLVAVGCGAALHHALVTLASGGAAAAVQRLPDERDPGLLAVVRYTGPAPRRRRDDRLHRAIAVRRTDRRSFADTRLGPDHVTTLEDVAARFGATLRPIADPPSWALPGHPGRYFVVGAAGDTRRDWLAAGEATSAVLLTATAAGLVTSVERFVAEPGPDGPAVVLGLGIAGRIGTLTASPHRSAP
ncbi:hypothetical protein ACPPVO_26195 [Dactylosporangium sp. McL0621]|uniref:hypothetical protein n=1 Tax=Dactylosporangium sp. McL0621 TaxID=3415678 RepID=UPI003CE9CA93